MRSHFFLFVMLTFGVGISFAQDPVFEARISGTKMAQHAVFSIQFELKNASTNQFQPPSFSDLRVVGGPSTSSSTMIVNGAVSKSQSWTYSLLATTIGKQTIGSAKVVVNGQTYKTQPITIEVLTPSESATQGSATDANEPIFLKAEVNQSSYYPGQQIILTYKLLFRENIATVSTMAEDDYDGFFIRNFANINPQQGYETINGKQYTSSVIKSLALFAHQSGTYEIDPLIMRIGINAPFQSNTGFFNMRTVQHVQVASEPIRIQVDPLPGDAPQAFSGAVGQYKMRIGAGQQQLTTSDAFTFHLEITGDGDARRWEIPKPAAEGSFEIYEPKILKDEEFEGEGRINQRRTIAYQMIPTTPGNYNVYVPFTYLDPETDSFVTIYSDTMVLNVKQGRKKAIATPSDFDSGFDPTLMPVRRQWFKDDFWRSFPHLLLLGLLLSGTGFGFMRVWRYKREQDIPIAERISRDAGQKAKIKLDEIEKTIDQIPAHDFFESTTEVFYSFLIDRFSIPSSELDESGLAAYLSKSGVNDKIAQQTKTFFGQCLNVRYGGTPGGLSKSAMLSTCREIISSLEG